jgi:hypothetical protein
MAHRVEDFERRVTRACAKAGGGAIDARGSGFDGGERVGDT